MDGLWREEVVIDKAKQRKHEAQNSEKQKPKMRKSHFSIFSPPHHTKQPSTLN